MTARGWGSSRQTLRKAENSTAAASPTVPRKSARSIATDRGRSVAARCWKPSPTSEGQRKSLLARLGIELVQHARGASGCRTVTSGAKFRAPLPQASQSCRIDPDLQMDEARRERCRHAMHHPAVGLAVAAGNQRGALGQLVFADLAVEDQLIQGSLHHRHRRRQLFEVDEPAAGIVGRRQEGRRRPAGAAVRVAPRDAAEVHGVEQERADVDILAGSVGGNLLRDHRFCCPGRSPYHTGLTRLDQEREGGGEFARAQRVVGGDGVGVGHGRAPEWLDGGAGTLRGPVFARPTAELPLRPACRPASGDAGDAGCIAPRDVRQAAPSHRPADARSREKKMDQWDRELAKAGIQMAGAAAKGMGNVMVAVIDGLIEKGVFSIEEVRDMLDRLEVAVRCTEAEIEGDLPQEAEVAATMAIVDHLRDILISRGRPG